MRRTLFFILSLVLLNPAWSQETDSSPCGWKEQSEAVIKKNQFVTGRGMKNYSVIFGPLFDKGLELLNSGHHFMDSGAGEGKVISDYYKKEKNKAPRMTAISYAMKENSQIFFQSTSGVKALTGEYFENIPKEKLTENFGPVHLLVDLFGVMSYTSDPSLVLNTYLEILDSQGAIFLYMGQAFDNKVRMADEKEIPFKDWLMSQPGLEVIPAGKGVMITKKGLESAPLPRLKTIHIDTTGTLPHFQIYQLSGL